MAIKQCKECGNDVSSKADKCPHCGYSLKSKSGCFTVIVLLFLIGYVIIKISIPDNNKPVAATHKADTIDKKIKIPTGKELKSQAKDNEKDSNIIKSFSSWDGSHIGLERYIKKSMNDPSSYEHVETRYNDKGDHLIVSTTFRGKNKFGALVKNTVVAKTDLQGNVVEIITNN